MKKFTCLCLYSVCFLPSAGSCLYSRSLLRLLYRRPMLVVRQFFHVFILNFVCYRATQTVGCARSLSHCHCPSPFKLKFTPENKVTATASYISPPRESGFLPLLFISEPETLLCISIVFIPRCDLLQPLDSCRFGEGIRLN